jgi:hypothetical protein
MAQGDPSSFPAIHDLLEEIPIWGVTVPVVVATVTSSDDVPLRCKPFESPEHRATMNSQKDGDSLDRGVATRRLPIEVLNQSGQDAALSGIEIVA